MAIRLSKKTSIISIILVCLVLGGSGGYLLWRTNQDDTVAPTDSDAGCIPVGTDECKQYLGSCDEVRVLKGCGDGLPEPEEGYSWCQHYELQCTSVCGDKICDSDETVTNCPKDCAKCGDNICSSTETEKTCPKDCVKCGDDICSSTETEKTCPKDCAKCGDDICSSTETLASCPEDCGKCGDDQCTGTETASTCPADCACEPMSWTNKPSGEYSVDSEFSTITITNPNSTSTEKTGVEIKLNGVKLNECSQSISSEDCYNLSVDSSGSQVVSITLFKEESSIKEGTYSLTVSLPGKKDTCSESTSFIIAKTIAIPQTGIFDGTMGRIYLGMGFVFLGFITTQTHRVAYMYSSLSEKSRIIQREKEIKSVEKKRNRFERKFE